MITAIACLAIALLLAGVAVLAIRSGQVVCPPALFQISRSAHPRLFWGVIALHAVGAAACMALALS